MNEEDRRLILTWYQWNIELAKMMPKRVGDPLKNLRILKAWLDPNNNREALRRAREVIGS